jgi:hypothetical protein
VLAVQDLGRSTWADRLGQIDTYSLSFDFTVPSTKVSAQAVEGPNAQLKTRKNVPLRQQETLNVANPKSATESPVTIGSSGVLR